MMPRTWWNVVYNLIHGSYFGSDMCSADTITHQWTLYSYMTLWNAVWTSFHLSCWKSTWYNNCLSVLHNRRNAFLFLFAECVLICHSNTCNTTFWPLGVPIITWHTACIKYLIIGIPWKCTSIQQPCNNLLDYSTIRAISKNPPPFLKILGSKTY